MVVSRTPFRISFFGGGTDYPAWYRENGGAVVSTTINKYCYLSCEPTPAIFDHKFRIVYSQVETAQKISEIKHPSVRAVMNYLGVERGLQVVHDSCLPARSGIGSSSAFTVGLLNALSVMLNRPRLSQRELADLALHVEQNVICEDVGSQDQVAVAHGGFNHIRFASDGSIQLRPVRISRERRKRFEGSLLLFFTGISRYAADIARSQISEFKNLKRELSTLSQLVNQSLAILESETASLDEIGKLLHDSWMLKRRFSPLVSSQEIDGIYEAGISAGATGGKLIGAGGGGFVLFYVKPEFQAAVRARLHKLHCAEFAFEDTGSQIVETNGRVHLDQMIQSGLGRLLHIRAERTAPSTSPL